jgi:serine/threonine protein kinase
MEYCPGGDLAALLALDKALPPFSVWQFALDLAAGLQHCHARGVVVGDLRPSRVLVANGWLKIGSLSRGLFARCTPVLARPAAV